MRSPTGAAPLAKGLACARCKTRKTRCDGEKPACGACLRSARFKHRPLDQVVCHYGDPLDDTKPSIALSPKSVPRLNSEDRRSSSELSTVSAVSTSSIASSSASTSSSSFASSSASFQSSSSFRSDADTDASSICSRGVTGGKKTSPPPALPLHHPYATYRNSASSLIASPTPSPLLTSKFEALTNPTVRRSPASQSFPFAGASSSHAMRTLSGRRRNAPCSIPIPMEARFDPAIPHSAPPTLDHFERRTLPVPSFAAADLSMYRGPDLISMGSFVPLPEPPVVAVKPTPFALAPPLYNLNSFQETHAHEQAFQQNTNPTYTATHQPDLILPTTALPNYELPPGGQLDGIGTTETPFKMDPERLVVATSTSLFDPDQMQWPLMDRRTGLTPLETLPTGFSPWPAWQGGPGTPAWPGYQ